MRSRPMKSAAPVRNRSLSPRVRQKCWKLVQQPEVHMLAVINLRARRFVEKTSWRGRPTGAATRARSRRRRVGPAPRRLPEAGQSSADDHRAGGHRRQKA